MKHFRQLLTICILLVTLWFTVPTLAAEGDSGRVSIDSSGIQANDFSDAPAISSDGRYVAFESSASNLVSGDTNGVQDIFIHDRNTATSLRASVDSSGVQANATSEYPSISADGRFVAFHSAASNLVSGDTNVARDIFVHDFTTGETTRVSVDSSGVQANDDSYYTSISADWRYVAFYSEASNLVSGDTNGIYDVFIHDRNTGVTTRISVDSSGGQANGTSYYPSISANGRYVAFHSAASNLVSGDTNGVFDTFVHDRDTDVDGIFDEPGAVEITRASVNSSNGQGNANSIYPSISADGRYVAFHSAASNLVSGDTNAANDIFVRDRIADTTTRVSVNSSSEQANGTSYDPSISADGRYVAFRSIATNLVSGDTNGQPDIFVHDFTTGGTTRVSINSDGVEANGDSAYPSISSDGRFVTFYSYSTNLVDGDTNGVRDIFVYEMDYTDPVLASFTRQDPATSPTNADILVFRATFSKDVQNVDAGDFVVSGTTATITNVTAVTGRRVYDITVSGGNLGTLEGTVGLNLNGAQNITDLFWTPLPAGEPTTDQTYDVYNTLPAATTPISPIGAIGSNYTPSYTWSSVNHSTWYYLQINNPSGNIFQQWYAASAANCNAATCSVTPAGLTLSVGNYTWQVQTWNSVGYGPWSSSTAFSVGLPGQAILSSPMGDIFTNQPTYTWNPVPDATWYYLVVNGPSGSPVIQTWYTPEQANCNTTTCSVTPATALGAGTHNWQIQTYNAAGYGPWSNSMEFSVVTPGKATLSSPIGNIATNQPTYTWSAVANATWYYLVVNGPSGSPVIQTWYTSAQANCNTTTCSVTPATALSVGTYRWWIQTYGSTGYGQWSDPMDFSLAVPGKATLSSPIGSIATNQPTYTWNAVPGVSWYYLWVSGPSGTTVIQTWYTSAQANCNAITCSVTPGTILNAGAHSWWIQTYNIAGYGPWSDRMDFTVSP